MIPLTLSVEGGDYGSQRFDFELARSKALSPLLAAVAVANSLSANLGYGEEATMLATGRLRLAGLPELPVEFAAASGLGSDPAIGIAITLQQVLGSLWSNPFSEVELEGVALDVRVESEVKNYRVEALHYDRGPLRRGQSFSVRCQLRRYRGETVTRTLELRVPDDLPSDSDLVLAVGPPDLIDRALGRPLARRFRSAETVQSVVQILGDLRAANRLTAVLYRPSPGVVSRGVSYADLPLSARRLMSARPGSPDSSLTRVSDLYRTETVMDGPIDGGLVVRLRVDSDLENGGDEEELP
jgi:hypothetical protein